MSGLFRRVIWASSWVAICLLSACGPEIKTADDFHREGILQMQKDDIQGALENFDQAVMLESSNPIMLVNRGIAHDELGQYEAAIADYTAAIERDEALTEAYYNRANAHHNLKQYEQAVADYSTAIGQREDFAYAYVNRAISLEAMGNVDRAIADLTRAVEIFERNGDNIDAKRVSDKIERLELEQIIEGPQGKNHRRKSYASTMRTQVTTAFPKR